ncbi:TonB-dependent receptor [Stakelama sediminis]|uniref:Iron complex outermembrane receptor protein n=1 Tax=Stakelama sediminis TaxID=463200 RepID=A0A840Z1X5_9SPHN|nr:TonB-dependent receptor [Stakelama sediminis]MBB5719998.1 iron complex outermembrane receptor protein [Stakelama sediminis]
MRVSLLIGAATVALLPLAASAKPADPQPGTSSQAQSGAKDIIVTATPFDLGADETPSISAKVDRQQILDSGGASIADSLKDIPGVAATGFAAGASRPIIRGMDATRVRILEDGLSSSDVSDIGPDHGIPIDPLSARSIEVVRGAAALRYGSQAIGGVVNAINNRVPTSLPDKDLSGEIDGGFDSVSDTGQGSVLADGRSGNLAVHVDGYYRHADDYDTPLGTQQNSFFHGYGQAVGASYFFNDDTHVGVAVTHYDAQYGIPSDTTFIDMHQTKVMTKNAIGFASGPFKSLKIDASYADYAHNETEPDGTVDTTFKNTEYDGRAELLLQPIGPIQNTAVGVEVQRRNFSAIGADSSYLFPTVTQSEAGYIFSNTPLTANLRLQVAGRVEHVHVEGTPASNIFTDRDFTPLSGAIGALYDLAHTVKLGLTFSSTGRAPAITELFARGGHDGPNTFETGDPNLKIERANSLEATIRVNSGRFRFEGSAYSSWFNNYIYGDLTGRTCDDAGVCTTSPDGELKELFYRQQGAHFRGLEGQASIDLVNGTSGSLRVKGLADYVRATLDDGSNVPRIPPYRYGGGMTWTGKMLDAGFLFLHNGRQDEYGAFDTPTPAFNDLSAHMTIKPFRKRPGIAFSVIGQNLTNDVQRNAAALNKAEVIAPGRNIRLQMKLAF